MWRKLLKCNLGQWPSWAIWCWSSQAEPMVPPWTPKPEGHFLERNSRLANCSCEHAVSPCSTCVAAAITVSSTSDTVFIKQGKPPPQWCCQIASAIAYCNAVDQQSHCFCWKFQVGFYTFTALLLLSGHCRCVQVYVNNKRSKWRIGRVSDRWVRECVVMFFTWSKTERLSEPEILGVCLPRDVFLKSSLK